MEKTGLSLTKQKRCRLLTRSETLTLLLPALPLTIGFWAMAAPILKIQMVLPILLSLAAVLGALWIGRARTRALWPPILLGGILVLCLLLRQPLQDSLGELLNRIFLWRTEHTGIYHLPYHTQGSPMPMVILLSLLLGFFTGALVQCRSPFWSLLLLAPLPAAAAGLVGSFWGLGLYLLGSALLLVVSASGAGKPLWVSAVITALLAGILGGIFSTGNLPDTRTGAGEALAQFLHRSRYESAANPMPEGKLENLPPYNPSNETALEVTMDHWSALYLPGYRGSIYTAQGWEPMDFQTIAQNAQDLYALQKDGFFPALQLDAGWQGTDTDCENTVTVKVRGACRAYSYIPYGSGSLSGYALNPAQLSGEGTQHPQGDTFTASLWPVESSYLLQETLSQQSDTPYLQAEAVYRQWVYDTCLALPEETRVYLQDYMDPDGKTLSTTQAKAEITKLLETALTYQEGTVTKYGETDFAAYVLGTNPRGYSVHYATLATLLMRSCGIPARYVEGYVVTPAQAEAMTDGETMLLRQPNAHAWCEYYLDGVGWLPFDATPGYTDTLDYALPDSGLPSESDQSGGHLRQPDTAQKPHDKPLPVDQKPDAEGLSHWIHIRQALSALGILLLLALVLLVVRSALLRRRLQKRKARFSDPDPRIGAGYLLGYSLELLELLGLSPKNAPLSMRREELQQILPPGAPLEEIITLFQEIWFSDHPITDSQRQLAVRWLELVTQTWHQRTSPVKRWLLRWLHCRVI